MESPEFKALLRKYTAGNCTAAEKALIEAWYIQLEPGEFQDLSNDQIDSILAMQPPFANEPQKKRLWRWIGAAAAVFVVISTGLYFTLDNKVMPGHVAAIVETDAAPGTNKATLTLATGKKIVLHDARTGVLANEADAAISKTEEGQVVYSVTNTDESPGISLFNTMTTPRGGQYHLTLADGTGVWLNAASSITYPTRFTANERRVEITGEAYFEVAHIADKPFHVVSKGQDVQVLGTHFNINTYSDEPVVKTTLLEGSVSVSNLNTHLSKLIKPGEQAINSSTGLKVMQADIDATMAWHEGDFVFNSQGLEEVMRLLSRWYDIDVNYDNYKSSKQTFTGVVSRSKNLSAVINMMKKSTTTLNFDIRGKTIFVSNR
ncbi:MAG: FecR domain-containing protein [Bacteroidota bacterium]